MSKSEFSSILPILMAGGEGSRLRPMTEHQPKPLLKIDGIPVLCRCLHLLAKTGYTRAVLTVRYLADRIMETLGDNYAGISLSYLTETGETPLGTAGSVRAAWDRYADSGDTDALILSGDAVFSADLAAFAAYHREKNAAVSILTARVGNPGAFGIVLSDRDGKITGFSEKPSAMETVTDTVNSGIYLLTRTFIERIPPSKPSDFGHDLFPAAVSDELPFYMFPSSGYWCDVGSHEAFRTCAVMIADGHLAKEGEHLASYRKTPLPAHIVHSSVGRGCFIPASCVVRDSVFFDGVTLGADASVLGSVLCDGVSVGRGAVIESGCVIGDHAVISDGAHIAEKTVIPSGTVIGGKLMDVGEKQIQKLYANDSGYALSSPDQPLLPDLSFCTVLGCALAAFAAKEGYALFFAATQRNDALYSAAALLAESAACTLAAQDTAAPDTPPELYFVEEREAVPFAAARTASYRTLSGKSEQKPLLRVLLTADTHRLYAVFCTDAGLYLTRAEERKLELSLSDALNGKNEKTGQPLRVVMRKSVPADRLSDDYRTRYVLRVMRKPFPFRTGNSPEERLLADMLTHTGCTEAADAPLYFHLLPHISLDDNDGTLTAADLRVPIRSYSHWELLAMFCVRNKKTLKTPLTLPFGAPRYLLECLTKHGIPYRFYTHCPNTDAPLTDTLPEARDGVLLAYRIAECLFEGQTTLRALEGFTFGAQNLSHVRMTHRVPVPGNAEESAAAVMRRLTEEAPAFIPCKEGVSFFSEKDAGDVRVIASRAPELRVIADSYSAESAAALCRFVGRRIFELGEKENTDPAKDRYF